MAQLGFFPALTVCELRTTMTQLGGILSSDCMWAKNCHGSTGGVLALLVREPRTNMAQLGGFFSSDCV